MYSRRRFATSIIHRRPQDQVRGRWRQPPAQVSAEVSFEAAQRRVAQFESALRAFEDASAPEVTSLRRLRNVQVPPCHGAACSVHCKGGETDGGRQAAFWKFREEVSSSPAPIQPPGWGAQVVSLQQMPNTAVGAGRFAAQILGRKGRRVVVWNNCHTTTRSRLRTAMPTSIQGLAMWWEERQADLQDAFATKTMFGLTLKMAKGAERLIKLTRRPETANGEHVLRGFVFVHQSPGGTLQSVQDLQDPTP